MDTAADTYFTKVVSHLENHPHISAVTKTNTEELQDTGTNSAVVQYYTVSLDPSIAPEKDYSSIEQILKDNNIPKLHELNTFIESEIHGCVTEYNAKTQTIRVFTTYIDVS